MTTAVQFQPEELLDNLPSLGSPPLVYRRLVEVLDDPSAGIKDVAEVIQQDPALTVRMLRIVNSAYFSFPQQIDTVLGAVNVMGTTQVRDLALVTSVTALFREVPPDLVTAEDFWRHSLSCGVAARVIAAARGEPDVERFFVAGMLHDIGRLVLYLGAPLDAKRMVEHAREHEVLLYESEQDLAGFDHAQIGGLLMSRWQMSDSLREAVEFHHAPTRATEHPVEAAVVHVADLLANALELGSSGELMVPPLSPEAWDTLSLNAGAIPAWVEEIERDYAESVRAFGLEAD